MRNRLLLFTLLSFCCYCCQSEGNTGIVIEHDYYSYVDFYSKDTVFVVNYQINNNSEIHYLTWIDYNNLLEINDEGKEKKIIRYFIRREGDFSFLDIMTGDILGFDSNIPEVGCFFLVIINPGESFKYSFIVPKFEEINDFDKWIIIEKKEKVEQLLGLTITERYFYNKQEIVQILNNQVNFEQGN